MPVIDKEKFLVPGDLNISQFIFVIRKRMVLSSEQALFLFIGGALPTTAMLIRELYSSFCDPDGFMYASYCGENTFGQAITDGDGDGAGEREGLSITD